MCLHWRWGFILLIFGWTYQLCSDGLVTSDIGFLAEQLRSPSKCHLPFVGRERCDLVLGWHSGSNKTEAFCGKSCIYGKSSRESLERGINQEQTYVRWLPYRSSGGAAGHKVEQGFFFPLFLLISPLGIMSLGQHQGLYLKTWLSKKSVLWESGSKQCFSAIKDLIQKHHQQ